MTELLAQNKIRVISILLIIMLLVVAAFFASGYIEQDYWARQLAQTYGYPAVFLIALVSGFNILVPIPAATLIPLFTEVGLSFYPLVLLVAFGMTMGDVIGYFIGYAGRSVIAGEKEEKMTTRLLKMKEKNKHWPLVFLGIYSFTFPLPNELVVIPMSFIGYRLNRMAPILLVGNTVFTLFVAWGAGSLLEYIVAL